jgi:hypothetical protein
VEHNALLLWRDVSISSKEVIKTGIYFKVFVLASHGRGRTRVFWVMLVLSLAYFGRTPETLVQYMQPTIVCSVLYRILLHLPFATHAVIQCLSKWLTTNFKYSNARNYNIRCTQATNIYSTGVHPDDTTISDFQVTHKAKGRFLKMAHKCRNM